MHSVLIVDDHPETCIPLQRLLRYSGYEADCVDSGREAISYIRQKHPNLVFLDVMMPEMDGFAVLRTIRGDQSLKDVRVVMYSAASDPQRRSEAMRLGAQGYVVKGTISYTQLEELVREHVETAQ